MSFVNFTVTYKCANPINNECVNYSYCELLSKHLVSPTKRPLRTCHSDTGARITNTTLDTFAGGSSRILTRGVWTLSGFYALAVAGTSILAWFKGRSPPLLLIVLPPILLIIIPLWSLAKAFIKKTQSTPRTTPSEASAPTTPCEEWA